MKAVRLFVELNWTEWNSSSPALSGVGAWSSVRGPF